MNHNSMSYHFSHTPFDGYEQEILDLLHRNRDENFSLEYLRWRYSGEPTAKPPVVFWIENDKNQKIGMCSLIFRKYWINAHPVLVGVAGDTSLDAPYRGQGIAKKFFLYINRYLLDNNCEYALAMANESFCRAAMAAGWILDQHLLSYVYIVDWTFFLHRFLPFQPVTGLFGRILNYLCPYVLRGDTNIPVRCEVHDSIIKEFDMVWESIDKTPLFIKDRSLQTLHWKYSSYHRGKYSFFHLFNKNTPCGIIVFSTKQSVCYISDIIITEEAVLIPGLKLFSCYLKNLGKIGTIRITLNDAHSYIPQLRKNGFNKRGTSAYFLLFKSDGSSQVYHDLARYILTGDKDI